MEHAPALSRTVKNAGTRLWTGTRHPPLRNVRARRSTLHLGLRGPLPDPLAWLDPSRLPGFAPRLGPAACSPYRLSSSLAKNDLSPRVSRTRQMARCTSCCSRRPTHQAPDHSPLRQIDPPRKPPFQRWARARLCPSVPRRCAHRFSVWRFSSRSFPLARLGSMLAGDSVCLATRR